MFSSVTYRKVLDLNANSLLIFIIIKRCTLNLVRYNYNENSYYIHFIWETSTDGNNGKCKWYFCNKPREQKIKLRHTVIQKNLMIYFNIWVQDNDFPHKQRTRENVSISMFTEKVYYLEDQVWCCIFHIQSDT